MSLQDVLAELRKNYLASLPEKIALIETLWSTKDFDKLETEYHKLKGTGRTYGLPEITQVGAALERLCEIDHAALETAVPLSLKLMNLARELRLKGETPHFDSEADFITVVRMVEAASPIDDETKKLLKK